MEFSLKRNESCPGLSNTSNLRVNGFYGLIKTNILCSRIPSFVTFGVIDENVGDIFALHGIMLSSDDNGPGDQSEAAHCQKCHNDVFPCHPTGTIGIPPVSIVAHCVFNLG